MTIPTQPLDQFPKIVTQKCSSYGSVPKLLNGFLPLNKMAAKTKTKKQKKKQATTTTTKTNWAWPLYSSQSIDFTEMFLLWPCIRLLKAFHSTEKMMHSMQIKLIVKKKKKIE